MSKQTQNKKWDDSLMKMKKKKRREITLMKKKEFKAFDLNRKININGTLKTCLSFYSFYCDKVCKL